MWPLIDRHAERFAELERLMSDADVIADPARFAALCREHGRLAKVVKPYREYRAAAETIQAAEAFAAHEADAEMLAMAADEVAAARRKQEDLRRRLEDLMLVDPEEDFDRVILEIRAGIGGDEAALFAGDLYEMYGRYARIKGWDIEEIGLSPGEAGGFKEVVFGLEGDGVFSHLRFESGGHRVQRVPKTETQGRIHTSAATVAVLPEPDEVQVDIRDEDLEISTMRAGGAGGQHVNKTESAVRIVHRPTGLEVKCQDERSQHKNKDRAMRILRGRLYDFQRQKLHRARAEQRRTLIGSGDRSERIRTYNFPQNRLTDHRINLTLYKLDAIMLGGLDEVVRALMDYDRQQRLGQAT
jgi:peptide chain release factor 1